MDRRVVCSVIYIRLGERGQAAHVDDPKRSTGRIPTEMVFDDGYALHGNEKALFWKKWYSFEGASLTQFDSQNSPLCLRGTYSRVQPYICCAGLQIRWV
jgi:hypothetical protein